MDFKVGDTVQLKSGSPSMTIARLAAGVASDKSQGAWCNWFDEKKQPQHGWYPLTSLMKTELQII
jgi:uncharacterized protein YodC (DUF2158 family)